MQIANDLWLSWTFWESSILDLRKESVGNVSDLVKSNMLLYLGAEGFNQKNKYTLSYTTFYALQHLFYELFMIFPKKT